MTPDQRVFVERLARELTRRMCVHDADLDAEAAQNVLTAALKPVFALEERLRTEKAHTYASENADLYRGFDNGCRRAAEWLATCWQPREALKEGEA